ncbi:2'-5' RNA ligase [Thermotomaculum hydrothermale]|uniref:RNA 2',3'-cyclic phosphodiesterase n=1 Tax=Thermotomaculum hydrothermale TaxID=981385 RepID=A0A7R6PKV7_9BACT|nr:RNA 2',3'-cyclic phosphodiesterase [Thermotomaculum hydrothermale]BBB32002.1 2'-5' RNA ligase [Thermotomaculum hydrothermale]
MKKRLFLALELPENIKNELIIQQNNLVKKLGVKGKTHRDALHLTLKFIGDFEEEKIESLSSEIERFTEKIHPFTLTLEKLSCFPDCFKPRIVFVSSIPLQPIKAIAESLDSICERFGVKPEKRQFKPHITIYRVKKQAKIEEKKVNPLQFTVNSITLFESILKPDRAYYKVVKSFKLSGE